MKINHLTFSVSDLERSIVFYQSVLGAKLLLQSPTIVYFDLNGIWLALNEEKNIPRNEINHSYTHIALSITEQDIPIWQEKLQKHQVRILPSRGRSTDEKDSIYFTDPDGHKFEVHTGTMMDRIQFYKQIQHQNVQFYD